jgi:hypothetical protein
MLKAVFEESIAGLDHHRSTVELSNPIEQVRFNGGSGRDGIISSNEGLRSGGEGILTVIPHKKFEVFTFDYLLAQQ